MDPYEEADKSSDTYYDWFLDHVFLLVSAQEVVGQFLVIFKEFPPRMEAASFTINQVLEQLTKTIRGKQ